VQWKSFANTAPPASSPLEPGAIPSTLSTDRQAASTTLDSTHSTAEATKLPLHTLVPLDASSPTQTGIAITTPPRSPQARPTPPSTTTEDGYYKSEVLEGLADLISVLKANGSGLELGTGHGATPGYASHMTNTTYTNSSTPRCGPGPGPGPGKVNFTLLVVNTTGPVFALLDRDSLQMIVWQASGPNGSSSVGDVAGARIAAAYRDSKFFYWGASIAFFVVGGLVYLALATKKVYEIWQIGRELWA